MKKTPPSPQAQLLTSTTHQNQPETINPHQFIYQDLQDLALLKLHHIIGDPKANPPIQPLLPISKSSFYLGISQGYYPAPIKFARSSFWRLTDIKQLLKAIANEEVK